jgi:hypothetical protein
MCSAGGTAAEALFSHGETSVGFHSCLQFNAVITPVFTIPSHRTPLSDKNKKALERLQEKQTAAAPKLRRSRSRPALWRGGGRQIGGEAGFGRRNAAEARRTRKSGIVEAGGHLLCMLCISNTVATTGEREMLSAGAVRRRRIPLRLARCGTSTAELPQGNLRLD